MNKNPIWEYLSENNLTTLDEQAWVNEYSSNAEKQTKLYNYLSSNNLTTLDQPSFVNKYLGKPEGVQTVAAAAAPVTPEEPQQPQTSKASGYIWEDGSIKQYEVKSKKDEEEDEEDKKTFADLIKEQKFDTEISIEGQKAFEERIQMLPEEVAAREILNQGDVMSPEYRQAFDLVKNAEQSRKLPESEKYKKA